MSSIEELRDSFPPTDPFYYAQDVDGFLRELEEERLRDLPPNKSPCKDELQSKSKKTVKKRKCQTSFSSTYIIQRGSIKRGRRLIKINVFELNDSGENDVNNATASISAQYVTDAIYDDVIDATNSIIRKIGEKMYETSV